MVVDQFPTAKIQRFSFTRVVRTDIFLQYNLLSHESSRFVVSAGVDCRGETVMNERMNE